MTLTTPEMTRFLMNLDQAVDTIFVALREAQPGEIYVPQVPSVRMVDVASALIGPRPVAVTYTGIRPGEKVHETLVSEEEANRTVGRGRYYAIKPMLPELALQRDDEDGPPIGREYSSADNLLSAGDVEHLLRDNRLLVADEPLPADPVPA